MEVESFWPPGTLHRHGHTPHRNDPITDGQSIDLDTLAWHTGRLVIDAFDDKQPGGPINFIEVLRANGDNPAV
ncbi:Serine/threonine protein phosphatase [Granulibacter bethesdensis CGDNIH4]|nr:Serine/threonine protein phosphatase [Granulibacter bethesdensis CGDNIH4]